MIRTTGKILFAALASSILAFAQPAAGFYNVVDFGASSDGKTKCTGAIRKAIEAASAKGGGTVYFPAGVFLTGPIYLKSNITLFIDAGAVVKFSTDFDDYLPMVASRWEGITVKNFSPLIYAYREKHIAIMGRGTLDGQGKAWWDAIRGLRGSSSPRNKWQEEFGRLNADKIAELEYPALNSGFLRPPFIQPYECEDVRIEGVTIVNSPFWTVTPVFSENVVVHAVTIMNPVSPNTDGINPDSCRNVRISNSIISVGDDCITIKSGRDLDGRRIGKPAENYTITNTVMMKGHGGVVIGSETSGGVKNITIDNCVFDGTDRGIRIKSARGRGGVVEDIRVSNIVMRNIKEEAFVLTMFYERSSPEPVSERTPIFRNIHMNGITGDAKIAGEVTGLSEMPIENITFSDIQLETQTGFTIKDAKSIEFHNVRVGVAKGPAIAATNTDGLEIDSLKTARPLAGAPVIDLGAMIKNVFVHGSAALPGTDVFLRVVEGSAGEVAMEGNHLSAARVPVEKR